MCRDFSAVLLVSGKPFAKLGLEDLAGGADRHLVDELHRIRHPPFGHLAAQIVQDRLGVRRDTRLGLDDEERAFLPFRVRHADGGRFRDQVKELTDGRGADVVYDGVGGAVTLESLRAVRFGARLLVVGWASTPDVADAKGRRGAPRANVLPTNLVLMKGLHVIGCPMAIGQPITCKIGRAHV